MRVPVILVAVLTAVSALAAGGAAAQIDCGLLGDPGGKPDGEARACSFQFERDEAQRAGRSAPPPCGLPTLSDETLGGLAVALDGDTLLLGGERVRLWGISAPEMKDWPWGAWARRRLDEATYGAEVLCEVIDHDRYGRAVAVCRVGEDRQGMDFGRMMLQSGLAVVYRAFTAKASGPLAALACRYDQTEHFAVVTGAGLWRDMPAR